MEAAVSCWTQHGIKLLKESLIKSDALQRQDSKHTVGQSLAPHFCIANADIQEYQVMKSKMKSSLKKLVSFFIQIN